MLTTSTMSAILILATAFQCAHGYGESVKCGVDGIICPPKDQIGVVPDGKFCVNGKSVWKNTFGYKAFDGSSYDGRCSFFGGATALPEGLGWFIIIGTGGMFALGVNFFMWLAARATPDRHKKDRSTSEHFSTGGRSVSAGLCAADIVSKWTWAATLLQSSNVAYKYGISGPFWYAAGATIQVLLFSVLAVEIKRKCPAIHTVLEIILARWGTPAHLVFLFFCCITNLIVTAMLILGGAAVVTALTGVNLYAASFLIPLSVVFYTAQGGIMAAFLSSWGHVGIIYIAMLIFVWKIYTGPSDLGSTDKVWENLQTAAIKYHVANNYQGTFLTMWSTGGIVFGIINIIGNFGTVFVDQSYWQGAIAARPSATYKGYLLGGISWFAIPFTMATSLGLAGRALDLPITIDESNYGLVPPAVAVHLLGPGGAFLITLQLFMAVTSTGAAEQIAVATLFSYDVWKRYIQPDVDGRRIVLISRITIVAWGCLSGVLSIILFELKISLGWVYLAMGNFIGSAVCPVAFAITWRHCSGAAAISGALGGISLSMIGWLSVASSSIVCGPLGLPVGTINVATLGDDFAMLTGNCLALFTSPIICAIVTWFKPQNYNWEDLARVTAADLVEEDRHATKEQVEVEDSEEAMSAALRWTYITGGTLTFILIFAWPLLTLPQQNFTKSYWGWWVAIAFIWGHMAAICTVLLPVWEARAFIMHIFGCKKYDFSATARGREGYDPEGPELFHKDAKTGATPTPVPNPSTGYSYSQPQQPMFPPAMYGQYPMQPYPMFPTGVMPGSPPMMMPGAPQMMMPGAMPGFPAYGYGMPATVPMTMPGAV